MSDQNPYGQQSGDQPDPNPWRPVGSEGLQSDPYYGQDPAGSSPLPPYGSGQQPGPGSQYPNGPAPTPQYGTPPYGQGQSPYGQGQPGTPYGQGQPGTPYGQGQPGTPYGQGQPGTPYGQGQPGTPYGQGATSYGASQYPAGPQPYPTSTYPGGQPPAGDPGTLDLPYYGIGFATAVMRAYQKIVRFDGRASRSEYWWFFLWNGLVNLVLMVLTIIGFAIAPDPEDTPVAGVVFLILWSVFMIGSYLPIIAITMRRLHDQNQSGGLAGLMFVPYVGGLITAIMAMMPSNPQGAHYDQVRSGPANPGGWQGQGYPG